jgi:hypothetical protein
MLPFNIMELIRNALYIIIDQILKKYKNLKIEKADFETSRLFYEQF